METNSHFFIVFATPDSRLHHFNASPHDLLSKFITKICKRCDFQPENIELYHKKAIIPESKSIEELGLKIGDIITVHQRDSGDHSNDHFEDDNCINSEQSKADEPSDNELVPEESQEKVYLKTLLDMGFKEDTALQALKSSNNDLERAVSILLDSISDL